MQNRAIALVGMPGSGKSSVGKILAELLHLPLIDTDAYIEQTARRSVTEIFAQDGEEHFRRLETEALRAAVTNRAVISCGGGIVIAEQNRDLLKAHCFVVYLHASADVLALRVGIADTRPLLRGDARSKIETLLAAREKWYLACGDVTVETDGKSAEEIAACIAAKINK